jgi:hypothetical protein
MQKHSIRFALKLALFCLALRSAAPAFADMTLVDANTWPCPIVADVKGSPLEGRMAIQLAFYLKKITGKVFVVKAPVDPLPDRAIIVGAHGIEAPAQLGPDGYILKTQGQRLFIVGGGTQGTAYGVFDFLERELGCRWWSWNEEDVPQRAAITLGDLDVKEQPAFEMHDIMSMEAQTGGNSFVYKDRAKSTLQFTGNHTMYSLLTPAAKEHPEFYPMDAKGERKPNNLHFNYLAPGIAQALADALGNEVGKHKGNVKDWIYFAGQGDWYGGLDQSEESKKAYVEDGASGPLVSMMNQTGAILQQKYPDIKVGTFAYMSTDGPPYKTVPGDNVYIWLPRLRYGTTLSIEEAASDKNPDEKSRKRSQAIKTNIEKWAQIAPHRFFIWEYGSNYTNFVKPWPSLRAMAENIKYYHRIGAQGVMIQSNYSSFGGDLAVLKNWVWSKLLWNPDQDVSTLLKQFCDGYYGPASADIQDYVNTLEDSVRTPSYTQYDEFYAGSKYLTSDVLAKLTKALANAEAKAQGDANAEYYRRVREVGASLDARQLWKAGPLVEKDGKLLRADIDKEHGGTYTFPRALELMKYLRGSSLTEFSNGVTAQRHIPSDNGGPIYTLTHGAVTAKIAPYQGLHRLWSVLLADRKAIAYSQIAPGSDYFVPAGEPTNDKVEIEGETGYGSWKPTPDYLQKETLTFGEDGALHWSGSFQQIAKGKPLSVAPRAETAYAANSLAEAQKAKVEIKTAAGWQAIPVTEFKAKGRPPLQTMEPVTDFQLRVTTPDGRIVVLDTYHNLPATGYAAVYLPKLKVFTTYVQLGRFPTEYNKTVPGFERVIQVQATDAVVPANP